MVMRFRPLWTAAVVSVAVSFLWAAPKQAYAPHELLVRFKSPLSTSEQVISAASFSSLPGDAARTLRAVGAIQAIPLQAVPKPGLSSLSAASVNAFEPLTRTYRVTLPPDIDIAAAQARLASDPAVELAEPNNVMHFSVAPNDTSYTSQWGLNNIGQSGSQDFFDPATGVAGADVDAELAWNATTGSSSMIVAIIDSGIDMTHPDLAANISTNPQPRDFADGDTDPSDDCGPEQGHGTHVAGIIGAIGNNGVGVAGLNWNVKLLPLKVAKSDGTCTILTSDIVSAINYAAGQGAKVINMSLGGPDSASLHTACDAAKVAGVVLVAAAGNDGTSSTTNAYPGAYPSVIGVAATNRRDQRASFSNFGSWVSMAAPGVAILSTWERSSGVSYQYESGTSMASPMVAGIAALVRSEYPSLDPDQVKTRLAASCEDIGDTQIGAGRINAARALLDLTSISPIVANAGNTTAFTIQGLAFQSGMTVKLIRPGTTVNATNLNVAAQNQATCDFNVPSASTGIYDAEIVIGQTVVTLPNAVTIVGLDVTSMSPSFAPTGTTVSGAAIGGHNFGNSISFSLQKSGQTSIPASNLVINSPTSAAADFDLTGAAGGRWDLVVTSGSFTNSLSKAFAVTTALYQVVTPSVASASQFTFSTTPGNIILNWPANATSSPINIDVDMAPTLPPVDPNVDPYKATGIGVDLQQVGFTPTFPVSYTLTLPFTIASVPDPSKLDALTIAYFNTRTNRWEPIKNVTVDVAAHTVTGSANHFSAFQIVQHIPSNNLDKVVAYPNPFRPDRGHDRIVFDFLEAGSSVKIFDVTGQLVRELHDDDGDGRIDWIGVTNSDGEKIASGIYYYLATSGGSTKKGRLAVVR